MSYEKATILSILSKIHNGELILPAIQRDFVWDTERMYKLLDSIFRGYPFSTLLFWNTKQRIQYREFTKDWSADNHFTFQIKNDGKKGTLVLDGQQRLQTLFLGIYGSYENKVLYFNLLSGIEPDDVSQAKYHFEYLSLSESELKNKQNFQSQYWIPLRELANLTSKQIATKVLQYLQILKLAPESEDGERLSQNISAAFGALKADESLNFFTIDKEFGDDGQITPLDEILEIFVRVNSGGQVLSKSDLMFSLMQMLWEGASDSIAELTDQLNAKERYDFDKDFILKVALVCTNHGARYEVGKLRNETNVKEIKENFTKIANALVNCKDFIITKGRFLDDRILRSYNSLIPFIYFFYLQPNQQVKSEETLLQMNQALYISLMTATFSRFADNYVDQVVNNIIIPHHQSHSGHFPLVDFLNFVKSKQGRNQFDDWMLQNNIPYLMNILEGGTRLPEGRRSRRPEVDHIFPQSKLLALGVPDEKINSYANFRLISQSENNWKRAQDPQPYFKANPKATARYFIPGNLLEYHHYEQFLAKRKSLIWNYLNAFFGLNNNELIEEIQKPEMDIEVPINIERNQNINIQHRIMELLTKEDNNNPIIKNSGAWIDQYIEYGLDPRWARRYHKALLKVGINSVGDFAAAIMALKLRIAYNSYLPVYDFISPLFDGNNIHLESHDFGGYGWKISLEILHKKGFSWERYIDKLE